MTSSHQAVRPRHGGVREDRERAGREGTERRVDRPGGRAARRAAARNRRRKRSWVRRTLLIVLALVVLATAGAGWLYLKLGGSISTFGADGLSQDRPEDSSEGENVLVIGSDARTGSNRALGGGEKGAIGRSDTAFLLHVYADHRHAVAVSVPRDTLVDIPPCKLPDGSWSEEQHGAMFNSAFSVGRTAEGNPACTQNTVEKLTGLRVDHTIVVDFSGFSKLTKVVGGVQVCVPKDVYEKDLNPNRGDRGKRIFAEGVQDVSGQRALDYVRLRHGIGDGSDIGRIKRQQAFVAALVKKVKSDGLTPGKLLPLADAAVSSMTVDPGLGTADKLLSFALSLKDIDLHNTKFVTVPWRYEGSRVAVVEPDADALWAALRADRTLDGKDAGGGSGKKAASGSGKDGTASPSPSAPAVDGTGIAVAVYNGTTVTGLAARAADSLRNHDFTVTGTATATPQDQDATVITYGPGQQDDATKVARLFPGAQLQQANATGISVMLGQAYADAPPDADSGDATATPPDGSTDSSTVPSEVADKARSADDDPCSDLSYG